jgi:hypothetical protein
MPPEWPTICRIEYARRAGIVPKADWVGSVALAGDIVQFRRPPIAQ